MNINNAEKNEFKISEQWDAVASVLSKDEMRPIRYGKCYRYLKHLPRQSRLLEVGCGEGTGLWYAHQLGFNDLTGVEVSEERLNSARARLGSTASLRLISTDCLLPFPDNTFDVIVSAAVIEHTVDPALFIREIARVARPGASIVISSDCWQWRILQVLGIYQSVQPIDCAMMTFALISKIRQSGLHVCHFDGFPLPGKEYRFVKMIWTRFTSPVLSAWQRILRMRNYPIKQEHLVQDSNSQLNIFLHLTAHPWIQKAYLKRLFLSSFSDENVYFVIKPK